MKTARHWRVGPDTHIDLDAPRVMGILNMTPDSFSDGGQHADHHAAVGHAMAMVDAGADIIDVGGESTRPGAQSVPGEAQISRILPVIEGIRSSSPVLLSVDTTQAGVAEAAIEAGADIINDVSGGTEDPHMLALAASKQCGLILMHRLKPPKEDSWSDTYTEDPDYGGDVVGSVRRWLLERAADAKAAGVRADCICLDPGLGFGKSVEQNWSLVAATRDFVETGYPILAAASRKSFIGAVTGITDPAARDAASAVVTGVQVAAGARLFRVHDVAMHRSALLVKGDRVDRTNR